MSHVIPCLESYAGKYALGNFGERPALLRFVTNTPGNWFIRGDTVFFDYDMANWFIKQEYCKLVEQYRIGEDHCYVIEET